ncbi:hypothetical protein GCM10022231_27680 [Gordonia caeni]|uniref:Uncharacterized protein n=2 Tax=Gordonia caeni TaxID=1007097 RepID=A0ABP7PGT9_9ACTN
MNLGVIPDSVRDVAGTDGQTLRGCRWQYRIVPQSGSWSVSQVVGNSPGLAVDKQSKRSGVDIWMRDLDIQGRTVGVHRLADGADCDTYVQSGEAAVNTIVIHHGVPHPPVEEVCERAIAFTKATIDKMPR